MLKKLKQLSIAPAVLPIVFLLVVLFPRFEDPDFYWHVKMGEYVFYEGFQKSEIFAYTSSDGQWLLTEWLAQVVIYLVYDFGGLDAVAVFVAFICTLCWYVNYCTCKKILDDDGKAIIVTLLFGVIFGVVAPRPHLFTFLLSSLLMRLFVDFKYYNNERYIAALPFVMMLWVNLHGGFFIGIVLMLIFTFAEWGNFIFANCADVNQRRRLSRLSLCVVLGVLAAAINPGGVKYWLYPYKIMISSSDMDIINEWQSPNFHIPIYQYFLIIIFLFFLCVVFSRKKPDLTEVVLPAVFAGGAFISVRNLPLAALALAPFFAVFYRDLAVWGGQNKVCKEGDLYRPKDKRIGGVSQILDLGNRQVGKNVFVLNWILLFLSILSVLIFYHFNHGRKEKEINYLMPVKAVDFVVKNHIEGNIFNAYHYGGYLIYRLHPWQKAFIYGKTDVYNKGFVDEFFGVYSGRPDWKKNFYKYRIDYVMCESIAPIRQLLLSEGTFKLVYDDGTHSVLLRNVKKYQNIIEEYKKLP